MTQEYFEYITKENDRWDLIAWQFYTDATLYEPIIKANPQVEITPTLKSGIKLKIPVIEQQNTIEFQLPPWRK
nr:hypothetical protein 5 [bacterium]